MAKHDKDIEYVGDSKVPAKRVPNVAPSYDEYPGKTELFWPNFLLKEWMVAAVVLFAFLMLTVMHPAPLEKVADPTNASYIPLPDWYFLFLYQLLKYKWASGSWVIFGVIVIPVISFGALFFAPWLDRGKGRRPSQRPVAVGTMLLALVAIVYLSWAAIAEHEKTLAASGGGAATSKEQPADFKAAEVFTKQTGCVGCHGANMEGGMGPALWDEGTRMDKQQILDIINNGGPTMMPAGGMFQGTDAEKEALAEYLASLKGE
jgi:mono/diheme cytochrome c family protein